MSPPMVVELGYGDVSIGVVQTEDEVCSQCSLGPHAVFTKAFCLEQVPCLLRLKHCPSVVFAGLDSPEDITDQTYQELFHTGGFVVSDNEVLETVTLGESLLFGCR